MLTIPIKRIFKIVVASVTGIILLASCNKDLPLPTPIEQPGQATTPTIASLLDDANFSILKAAVAKAGLLTTLADPTLRFTVFAPDDAAFVASGVPLAAIGALPEATVKSLISYHIIPQVVKAADIPTSFPNLQYPSILNPAPTVSALLRLTTFPSKRGTAAWVNNIPITATDITAVNGVVHKVARVVAPPTQYLWDRISTDANLTYLKAAVARADSGVAAAGTLQGYLSNIGANFTVFAPSNLAFQQLLTGSITLALIPVVTQQLIAAGLSPTDASAQAPAIAAGQAAALASTPDVFNNPALYGALSATTVKGIVVYHLLNSRAFSVNLPTTATNVPTLLNSAIAAHPGVTITATMSIAGVTAATVKGVANPTASNIQVNPTPAPAGTSDQHYLNGVLHIIDQVLRPQ